jgi:hypothetical protein
VELDLPLALVAALVGLLVGLTGVGAGALMTPILIVFFSIPPAVAIATDLLYAAITKLVGGVAHLRHGGVDWRLLRRLWLGGIVGVVCGVAIVFLVLETAVANDLLRIPLAVVVLLAALSLLSRGMGKQSKPQAARSERFSRKPGVAVAGGAGIGVAVSMTSVGAGALGMALLAAISPRGTSPRTLVGTDLLFAVPVAFVAGLSYLAGGLVDVSLLVNLLLGSLPGVFVGSALSGRAPARLLSVAIGAALIVAAVLILI